MYTPITVDFFIKYGAAIEDRFGRDGIESVVIKNFGLAPGRESYK